LATAFVIPVSASSETSSDDNLILNGSNWALRQFVGGETRKHYLTNYSNPDFLSFFGENPLTSVKEERIEEILQKHVYDISSCYYIARVVFGDNGISVNFAAYDIEELGDTLNFYYDDVGGVKTLCSTPRTSIYAVQFRIKSSYLMGTDTDPLFVFNTGMDYTSQWMDNNYGTCYYNGIITNIPNITYGDKKINNDGSTPPIPFTVTYSPELSDDMKNVVYIPSKGGANGDENGLVEQQKDSFELTVTLTDEYIELLNKYPDLNKHTYEFIVYITTEPPESVGYSQSANKAVYTDVHYGYYMYTTSGVVADVTDDYNEPTNWIKAQGANIGYIIPKGQKSKTVSIRLENIDTSQLSENQHLYCVVYGRQTLLDYPTPDYFNVANQQSLCKGELNSTITYVIEDDDNDPNNNIEVVAPDYYCATSDPFYFSEYPEYISKRLENGEIFDTNKGVFAYTDKKITPDKMWDFEMASNGDKGLSPDDFKVYEDNKKLSENYQSFNFDATDLTSIFTEGTDFFKFLTTSISILPSYFMTILISFFTVFLAIVLIKFVF
ncbi:MAG: hypothetical protein Q4E74_09185, partial [Ruminococcus sp.]|nr:hypothetical protein [Ruminococcus sp.]